MARHDVLHSRLAISGNRPVQRIEAIKTPDLDIIDVPRSVIAAHREGGEPSPLGEFVDAPINLLADSGFRCRLFRDEEGNITLGMVLHHYFGDGWSSQILRREISATYSAIAQNQLPELAAAAQYADYAGSQRQSLSANLDKHLSYWRQRLEKSGPSRLPYDHVSDTNRMGRLYFGIPEDLTARLAAVSQSLRVSAFIVYLAALQLLIAAWSGEKKAVTAVNTADRIKPQFQNTVGYLIASVPIYTEFEDGWNLGDLLSVLAKNFYDAYAHRDLSYDLYDQIVEAEKPFCTTLFNFIPLQEKISAARSQSSAPPPVGIVAGPSVQRVRVHREIYFCLVELPRGMVGKIYYNMDFFESGTIEALLSRFHGILEKMAADPNGKVAAILQSASRLSIR
ncbi:MAG TPA: condensation domain-containing protein [Rhizomicrobium sp.]|nr:condensation domain-containing protein [Rhizomicrobium sp.]